MRAILTKVDDEMYQEIRRRMEQYGFHSVYEFIHGVVGMALMQMARIDYRNAHPNETFIEDEIDEMFANLSDWETPKYGERTKRGHKPWDLFGEQEDVGQQCTEDMEEYDVEG